MKHARCRAQSAERDIRSSCAATIEWQHDSSGSSALADSSTSGTT